MDCRARKLTDEQRSSLAAYLSVYKGTEAGSARLGLSQVSGSNHPALDRALRLLSAAWTEVTALLPQRPLLSCFNSRHDFAQVRHGRGCCYVAPCNGLQ